VNFAEPFHAHIRASTAKGQPYEKPAWLLLTDGSGHADGYGGYAAVIVNTKTLVIHEVAAGIKGTSTEEAEFLGLLNGLKSILGHYVAKSGRPTALQRLEAEQPVIHWITDRESLALSVWRDPKTNEPVYRRKSTPELWAMYRYFEPLFRVVPLWTKRQTLALHNRADVLASELRVNVKEYFMIDEVNMSESSST
jgi:ribonuclease HI